MDNQIKSRLREIENDLKRLPPNDWTENDLKKFFSLAEELDPLIEEIFTHCKRTGDRESLTLLDIAASVNNEFIGVSRYYLELFLKQTKEGRQCHGTDK